ncbi:DUF4446 family protein [Marinactinospora thermotolerans]
MLSTMILAMTGLLLGLGGALLGALALRRARATVDECRTVVRRLVADAGEVDTRAIRDVAIVRYDALEEMSGARSFSLAMLNAAGDGVVLTSINGRTETRTYAKTVEGGKAVEAFSPEEYRAVRAARLGGGPGYSASDDAAPPPAVVPVSAPTEAPRRVDDEAGGASANDRPGAETRGKGRRPASPRQAEASDEPAPRCRELEETRHEAGRR